MSEELKKVVVDCSTGIVSLVPLTQEELNQREQDAITALAEAQQKLANEQALEELRTSAKAKLVAGEPLTEEEASVLIS